MHAHMRVRLDVYDLAGGGLRWLPSLLAPHHNIWPHVVLSVYGREYTYNGEDGVREMPRRERRAPESHLRRMGLRHRLAKLHESVDLGTTQPGATQKTFDAFLRKERAGRFAAQEFNMMDNSCVHFAKACADHLVGAHRSSRAGKEVFDSLLNASIRAKRAGLLVCLSLAGPIAYAVSSYPPPLRPLDQTSWTG